MEKNAHDVEFGVTNFHWWFVVRRKLLQWILSSNDTPFKTWILDVGCGVGSNLSVFRTNRLKAIGLDKSSYALSLASKRFTFPLVNGDLNELPFKPNSIGIIVAMDILEHLEDDLRGIRELYQTLAKDGVLIVTVPAFMFLWGTQDIVTNHKRRYARKEILEKLTGAGFRILRASYFNFFLFLPILLARYSIRILGIHPESENTVNSPLINSFLKMIFSFEPYILNYVTFPFGVSIFCIAQK